MKRLGILLSALLITACGSDFPVNDGGSSGGDGTADDTTGNEQQAYIDLYTDTYVEQAVYFAGSDTMFVSVSHLKSDSYEPLELVPAMYLNGHRCPIIYNTYSYDGIYRIEHYFVSTASYLSGAAMTAPDSVVCHAVYTDNDGYYVTTDTCRAAIRFIAWPYGNTSWDNFDSLDYGTDSLETRLQYQEYSSGSKYFNLYVDPSDLLEYAEPHTIVGRFLTTAGNLIYQKRTNKYIGYSSTGFALPETAMAQDTVLFKGYLFTERTNTRTAKTIIIPKILGKAGGIRPL